MHGDRAFFYVGGWKNFATQKNSQSLTSLERFLYKQNIGRLLVKLGHPK